MDKRVVFSAAGSGKTTYIVNHLSAGKRFLIITFTEANYRNIEQKVRKKFEGVWPEEITLMTFFVFLYRFCYKPFLADRFRAKGLCYQPCSNRFLGQNNDKYFLTERGYLYSNRLSLLLEREGVIDEIKRRIEKYYDEFIIDEVQDVAGRDFNFLEQLMTTSVNVMLVGDYYQHTYDTSRDGNVNSSLFDNRGIYESRFSNKGIRIDNDTLKNSWRCSRNVCHFVATTLSISISSNRSAADNTVVECVQDPGRISSILQDGRVVKLHYQNASKYGLGHRNWGDVKGEDCYNDVCVLLNKTTAKAFADGKMAELAPSTRNKLYVAITRARGNVYIIDEKHSEQCK